jgi:hypothetical protein
MVVLLADTERSLIGCRTHFSEKFAETIVLIKTIIPLACFSFLAPPSYFGLLSLSSLWST